MPGTYWLLNWYLSNVYRKAWSANSISLCTPNDDYLCQKKADGSEELRGCFLLIEHPMIHRLSAYLSLIIFLLYTKLTVPSLSSALSVSLSPDGSLTFLILFLHKSATGSGHYLSPSSHCCTSLKPQHGNSVQWTHFLRYLLFSSLNSVMASGSQHLWRHFWATFLSKSMPWNHGHAYFSEKV